LRQTYGQDLIEYVLLGTVVALLVVSVAPLGIALRNWYVGVGGAFDPSTSAAAPGPKEKSGPKSNCSDTGASASKGKCR
jgi:hypothetical protein